MPSMSNIMASLIFGGIGFVAFVYGKKQLSLKAMILGGLLMGYTYFVTNTWAVYGIGIGLTAALFVIHD